MSVFFTRFCSGSFFPLLLFSLPLLFCLFPALIDVFFFLKIHICMKFFFIVISSLLGGMVGEVHNGIKTVQNSTSCFLAGLWCWLVGWLLLMNVFFFQSNDNEERLQVVKLLAKMFGAKDSELASQNKPLWQCYLGRYAMLGPFTGGRKHSVNCNSVFLNSFLSFSPHLFFLLSNATVNCAPLCCVWRLADNG